MYIIFGEKTIMKLKTIYLTGLFLLILVCSASTFGCKKQSSPEEKLALATAKSATSNENLTKFLSVTLGVKPEEVILNSNTDGFVVRGLKFNKDSIEKVYNSANEYKLNFENK